MNENESYGLTWQDILFGLTGSTIFVIGLHFFTGV
ncbi:hypothetical protein H4683_002794 [Filibacter limicola]|uniref:Uncharacterized protein n=1 Tax=Sporosarcina limicola TaxID=34101 RepID=A0A927R769_9BACL|nr:hypothetical protein [Sporosarcina limicola]